MVSADGAIASTSSIILGSGNSTAGLAFSGNYNGTIQNLTLVADAIIDLGLGAVRLSFSNLTLNGYSLAFYNWSGNTLWSGSYGNGTDRVYQTGTPSMSASDLQKISFYTSSFSPGLTSGFSGSGFQNTANGEIFGVPEPRTYVLGLLLLGGMGVYFVRKRVFSFQRSDRAKTTEGCLKGRAKRNHFSRDTANKGSTFVSSVNRLGGSDSILTQFQHFKG